MNEISYLNVQIGWKWTCRTCGLEHCGDLAYKKTLNGIAYGTIVGTLYAMLNLRHIGVRGRCRCYIKGKAQSWMLIVVYHAAIDTTSTVMLETQTVTAKAKPVERHDQDVETKDPRSALQMISQGPCLPGIPQHPTFASHRQWLLERMALGFRMFARKGYTDGMAGHISVRDPEHSHTLWTVRQRH